MPKPTRRDWKPYAERRLRLVLRVARESPSLRRRAPSPGPWQADLSVVSGPKMAEINGRYRKKPVQTDILSFPSQAFFRAQGHLGELVICLPVLKRQGKELGHSPEKELDVLLVHGVLHLLGLDHEGPGVGSKEAAAMARWEVRLLARLRPRATPPSGLIERVKSIKVGAS